MEQRLLNEKGVIPYVHGGLGNQLFIVSAAFVAHKELNIPLYIFDAPFTHHNILGNNYNKTIFKFFGIHTGFNLSDQKYLENYSYDKNIGVPMAFAPWNSNNLKPGVIMKGYYQFYPALKPYEDEIREKVLKGLNPVPSYTGSAFLHVRRGDFMTNPAFFVLEEDYYRRATELLLKLNPLIKRILVLSTDLEWVKSKQLFKQAIFTIVNEPNELDSLAIMSQASEGAIMANSTFSWWGAFLGAHSRRNPVILPSTWMRSLKPVSLFPEEWHIIGEI